MKELKSRGIKHHMKLAIIHQFRIITFAISAATMIDGLVQFADGWDVSLGLHNIVVHLSCIVALKIIWYMPGLFMFTLEFSTLLKAHS